MDADRSTDRAPPAGEVGLARRRHRRRDGPPAATTARHIRLPTLGPGGCVVHRDGDVGGDRGTVGHVVEQWAASRVDVTKKTRAQYEWAAARIKRDLGGIRVDRLEREDVARWLDGLAAGGKLARRSIVIFRTVLRAALADAVEARAVAAQPGAARRHAAPFRQARTETGDNRGLDRAGGADVPRSDRRAPLGRTDPLLRPLRTAAQRDARPAMVGRRSEEGHGAHRAQAVEVHGRPVWTEGKNARSRRTIPIDPSMAIAPARTAGSSWRSG